MAASTLCGWWMLLLSCMVMIGENNEALACLEDEKIALLKLKEVINHQNGSVPDSWSDEKPDCCQWNWLTCDVFSKKIINLELWPFTDTDGIDNWFLDASLFQPFKELLNLSFQSSALQGLKGPLRLAKLQMLDLHGNEISHVPLLGELPSLKFLDLSANAISQGFEELTNLKNLEILRLSQNNLNGSLQEGLCTLTNLQELDLSKNELEGAIPTCLSNLTSLRTLKLSENKLSGTIPSNVFSSLTSLKYVVLSYNYFDGFSFSSFADNSKLEVFELDSYNPNLKVDTENVQWNPLFQLKVLILSNCKVNEPSFLLRQYDLRIIDLSNNGMTGELPSWLITNNSRLEILSLRNNFFTGRLTLQFDSFRYDLFSLDVSMNRVVGEIPTFIGSLLPSLVYWNMSINAFEGSIPSSIENMGQLISLNLANNRLSGEIPGGLFTGCRELVYFHLSNNKLGGNFLLENMQKLSRLHSLYLNSNNFSGDLTLGQQDTLSLSLGDLRILDISNNSFSGKFPDWISELSSLFALSMSKNYFEGKLPASFCKLTQLVYIDLSWNNFSDTLPPCTNLLSLKFLHLQGNKFSGLLPTSLSMSSSMVTLDVRDNSFSGLIPAWINSLSHLINLLLKGNIFHGSIPTELCQLENLNILDLAANNLSGSVPTCLAHIPFGKYKLLDFRFDVGEGEIPEFTVSSTPNENENYQLYIDAYTTKYIGTNVFVGTATSVVQEDMGTSGVQEEVQLITKSLSEIYKGAILYSMSAIDLSFNNLTGPIPFDISNWGMVHSLNLSYNHFNGTIPRTLSRLKALESLDLSHNMLSGEIPSQITDLNFLSVFSVAHNNLSGPTPTTTGQFGTFNASSYEGNPLLCGLPLDRSCNRSPPPPPHAEPSTEQEQNDFSFKTTFLWSFFGSFVVSCIGALVFFYFNTNVLEIFLGWIGIERVPRRSTVELPWQWNK